MNCIELKERLSKEPLLENTYCIGRASDNNDCLVCEDNVWSTFYYEKGRRVILRTYANESEACTAFYNLMMDHLDYLLKRGEYKCENLDR